MAIPKAKRLYPAAVRKLIPDLEGREERNYLGVPEAFRYRAELRPARFHVSVSAAGKLQLPERHAAGWPALRFLADWPLGYLKGGAGAEKDCLSDIWWRLQLEVSHRLVKNGDFG